jgi:hypothetical protein
VVESALEDPAVKKLWWAGIIVLFLGIEGVHVWQFLKLRKDLAALKWDVAVAGHDEDNVITTDVGTIQFLKRGGYSIQLDTAKYTNEGLELAGFVGNPTHLWISNLSLKFSAQKQLYQYEDDFTKDEFSFYFGPQAIGEAQSSPITSLIPGTRQPFSITIPNVKQTKEGIRLVVVFTGGERYSYGP